MSRRSFPRIPSSDLRDHADEARIDRIWERIESDLPNLEAPAPRRRAGILYVAIAASFAAFGAGLFTGKVHYGKRPAPQVLEATPSTDKTVVAILAAGSEGRSFELPGGSRLALGPGATVEMDRSGAEGLTLKLIQGEASIDTAGAARPALCLVAGDARVNTQAGSAFSVRRSLDEMDVSVTAGAVSLSTPAGLTRLERGQRADAVPIHAVVASAPRSTSQPRAPSLPPRRARQLPAVAKGAQVPTWFARYNENKWEAGFVLLQQQPGGIDGAIASARSAAELSAIRDLAETGHDYESGRRALERVIKDFPSDPYAMFAADRLAALYDKEGKADRAKELRERYGRLSQNDALACNQIQSEANKRRAAELGMEYLRTHPNGQCTEDVKKMVLGEEGTPAPTDVPDAPAAPVAPAAPSSPAPSANPSPAPPAIK